MSQVTAAHPLMFGDVSGQSLGALRWLSPALIGLSAPIGLAMYLLPGATENARAVFSGLLFVLLLVCIVAYIVSVLMPGEVSGFLIDRDARQVEFITDGMFATGRRAIAFEDVSDLRMTKQYDRDGYALDVAEARLAGGETIVLPTSVSAADVAVARRAIGLATTTRR